MLMNVSILITWEKDCLYIDLTFISTREGGGSPLIVYIHMFSIYCAGDPLGEGGELKWEGGGLKVGGGKQPWV